MKKYLVATFFLIAVGGALAETKPAIRKESSPKQTSTKEQPAPAVVAPAHVPTGPTGFGAIKIGLTKEAVEALQASDGVYLNAPLTPYEDKNYTPRPGVDKFNTALASPLSTSPLEATLTFVEGQLLGFHVKLDPNSGLIDRLKNQIAEKYGAGKVEDDRKEEQCIYRNGSNFKITTGTIATKWTETTPEGDSIETTLNDWVFDMCPTNLRYGTVGGTKLHGFSVFKKPKQMQSTPAKSLF